MKTKQLVITFHCYMGYFSDIKMLQELKIILSTMSPHLMRKTSIKCPQQDWEKTQINSKHKFNVKSKRLILICCEVNP